MNATEVTASATSTCPDWCMVDHRTDGYSRHGHTVHRATVNETPENCLVSLWWSTQHAGEPIDEPAEVHLSGLAMKFNDPAELRRFSNELMALAGRLESIQAVR